MWLVQSIIRNGKAQSLYKCVLHVLSTTDYFEKIGCYPSEEKLQEPSCFCVNKPARKGFTGLSRYFAILKIQDL